MDPALPHYSPTKSGARMIDRDTPYHRDSSLTTVSQSSTCARVHMGSLAMFLYPRWPFRLTMISIQTKDEFNGDIWPRFERCMCVPIQTGMVKESMLTKEEKYGFLPSTSAGMAYGLWYTGFTHADPYAHRGFRIGKIASRSAVPLVSGTMTTSLISALSPENEYPRPVVSLVIGPTAARVAKLVDKVSTQTQ
ncbi:hypothetical protein AZE42_07401 [Rhizopogon vesiculosus]|uniref:Uncharacterized protein n=1 Tax=Rhizopogon vesiculosus TaxID=180088 RepID=A0A1J8QKF2_9AGAM|nr:hypothetical protein AZE42_07401 [Rhizopogon vesiculosus]